MLRGLPSASDLVFVVVLVMAVAGGRHGFLNDPGTFWHLRLGRDILATGRLPHVDTLTTTRAGRPWVDQSWAFDVLLAWLVDHAGWTGAAIVAAVGLATLYAALTRSLVVAGHRGLVAFVVGILAAGIGSIHFLLRPHLFTFGFMFVALSACRRYHLLGSRSVWLIPPLAALWANVHGGFLAGPLIVLTATVGHAASSPWDAAWRQRLTTFSAVFLLTSLAPFFNPYGPDLFRHVAGLLHESQVTDLIEEYQPSPFGKPPARILEWVILALVGLSALSAYHPRRYDLAHALVWLHLALTSIRHAPLFGFAMAPVLACGLDALSARRASGAGGFRFRAPPGGRIGDGGVDAIAGPASAYRPRSGPPGEGRRFSPWPLLAVAGVVAAWAGGSLAVAPDPGRWPLSALPAVEGQPADHMLFHEQDWGGLIESECVPRRRAYLDDRFELWGREPILEYASALQGGPGWDAIVARDPIQLVWLRPERGLAKRLVADGNWEILHRDRVSILLRRRGDQSGPGAGSTLALDGTGGPAIECEGP
jgi:hypothetical protein